MTWRTLGIDEKKQPGDIFYDEDNVTNDWGDQVPHYTYLRKEDAPTPKVHAYIVFAPNGAAHPRLIHANSPAAAAALHGDPAPAFTVVDRATGEVTQLKRKVTYSYAEATE